MEERVITLDQIPTNPLDMPPPYWRSSGAIFHVLDALEELSHLLSELLPIHERTELQLDDYYERRPGEPNQDDDAALEEFGEICDELWELEHRIKLKAETAIFMSAIQAEDDINRFCVFNLHKDIADSIESLSPAEKLLVASAASGKADTKGNVVFEATRKLSAWRNAFAHGHCVDRPTKSLRHNHLISPAQYPGVPDTLAKMKELVGGYLRIQEFLGSISKNPYTAGPDSDAKQIREYLKEISRFHFDVSKESNDIYSVNEVAN